MNRRPLKSRSTAWARAGSRWLLRAGFRPNTVSLLSVAFAAGAGACLAAAFRVTPEMGMALLLLAAAGVQLRLLCNLMDGLLAVEGGLQTPGGEVFNDLPDRLADTLILLGAGYGLTAWPWGPPLGWLAAWLAVMTAYVRVLGGSCGLPQRFSGLMAKPQRMAVLTGAAAAAALAPEPWRQSVIAVALALIAAGSLLTVITRTGQLLRDLDARP